MNVCSSLYRIASSKNADCAVKDFKQRRMMNHIAITDPIQNISSCNIKAYRDRILQFIGGVLIRNQLNGNSTTLSRAHRRLPWNIFYDSVLWSIKLSLLIAGCCRCLRNKNLLRGIFSIKSLLSRHMCRRTCISATLHRLILFSIYLAYIDEHVLQNISSTGV